MPYDGPAARRTLLVLAATANQLPVIRRAREMGVRVVTADNNPANPGHSEADASREVDTTDTAGLLALARAEVVHGVLAAATDVALLAAARLAEALDLVAPQVQVVEALVPKAGLRRLQDALGLPAPLWSDTGLPAGEGPFIVKPNLGSGSRGVRVMPDAEKARAYQAEAGAVSLDGRVVTERCLAGSQHSAEGVLAAGRVAAMLVTDRRTAALPNAATRGHRVPSAMPRAAAAALRAQVETVFAALGHRDGPFDADVVLTPTGPVLLELAPRAGGNALIRLVPAATGFDYAAYLVSHALGAGVPPASDFPVTPAAAAILGLPRGGVLAYRPDAVEPLRAEEWVEHLAVDLPPGTSLRPFTDGRARFGEAVVTGATGAEVTARLEELAARLALPDGAIAL
jgi:biotin carboxylase